MSRESATSVGTIGAKEEFAAAAIKQDKYEKSGNGRRDSKSSITSQQKRYGHHHISNVQHYIHDKHDSFHRWLDGKEEKNDQETRLHEMATVIRTYRGLDQEIDTDEGKPWVDREPFLVVMSIVILLNSIIIGLDIDFAEGKTGLDRHLAWIVLEAVFAILFLSEVGLKVQYNTWRWILRDFWNLVAAITACLMLLDFALGCFQVVLRLRLLSLIRIGSFVRLARIIKRHRSLDDLHQVILGLTRSWATMAWTALMMLVFIYISAVFATFQIGHNAEVYDDYRKMSGGWNNEEFFGTVGRSMYTFLQMATLDQWCSQIARHVVTNQAHMAVVFIVLIAFIPFGLLNIVVSAICEHMLRVAEKREKQARARKEKARRDELSYLKEIFEHADVSGTGEITLTNFLNCCKDPTVAADLRELQLPTTDAAKLFAVIDGDGSRTLTMKEFISGCTQLKGPAQSKALLAIQAQADTLAGKIEELEDNLDQSERLMMLLDEITSRSSRRFVPAIEGTRRKLAHAVGGTKPLVPTRMVLAGNVLPHEPLSLGNRPVMPQYPNMLRTTR